MPGYEARYVKTSVINNDVVLKMCTGCGSVVIDQELHDAWHEEMAHVASNAHMLDRIG